MCLNIKICKCLVSNQTHMSKVHPLQVVGEKLNQIARKSFKMVIEAT